MQGQMSNTVLLVQLCFVVRTVCKSSAHDVTKKMFGSLSPFPLFPNSNRLHFTQHLVRETILSPPPPPPTELFHKNGDVTQGKRSL